MWVRLWRELKQLTHPVLLQSSRLLSKSLSGVSAGCEINVSWVFVKDVSVYHSLHECGLPTVNGISFVTLDRKIFLSILTVPCIFHWGVVIRWRKTIVPLIFSEKSLETRKPWYAIPCRWRTVSKCMHYRKILDAKIYAIFHN